MQKPQEPAATCTRCGAPLPRSSRRKEPVCRVCATKEAQSFLRHALTNRRRRPMPDADLGPGSA